MNRNAILLLMLIFMISGVSTEVPDNSITVSFEKPNYVLSQTEVPIYEIITPEVDEAYAEEMGRALFDISEIQAEEVEGVFYINRGNESFEVDTKDGSMWYADYSKLWNISLGIGDISPTSCRDAAADWLRENGILPHRANFVNVGTTNATAFNPDTETLTSKILQYNVNYQFSMGDVAVTGEAGQITLMYSGHGDIVGFDWNWREPKAEPYKTMELIEYESILEEHRISADEVVSHRLVYTIDDEPGSNLLYPVYEIELIEDGGEEGIDLHYVVVIDATLLNPQVEITTPSGALVAIPGETITFDCSVAFGTPPYTYEWGSDHSGALSTSKSFTTEFLPEVLKKDVNVPHCISVRVRDADNRGCSDCVSVTIEPGDFNQPITFTLVAVSSIAVLVAGFLIFRRRKITPVLFFLLMMFSAFMFLPIASAGSGIPNTPRFTPSVPTGAFDDGIKEIGIEWVGMSHGHPLWYTEQNIEGWYNWMGTTGGYNREFNWGEYSAWEEDFKDASHSGTDTEWIDAVDFVYYQDHGGPDGVAFTSNHDDHGLHYLHMRLGDGDLDSIVFDACSPLAWENEDGDTVFERWGPAMQGVHQVCSFGTTSKNSGSRGTRFATYMTDGMTIVSAWFRACAETEAADRLSAYFYATKSPDPYNPQLDDPINDHAFGFGYVCSDPKPGEFLYYVYIVNSC